VCFLSFLFVLCGLFIRITFSVVPFRHLPGVLVVSDHTSWLDIVTIGAVLPTSRWRAAPASFVGRADVAGNLVVRMMTFIIKVIPIDRASLRQLPGVVDAVATRLRAGQTVVAFPEGTTWCGLASGPFYPAMFQAAVDTGRPVQPLRLRYHHRDGRVSTVRPISATTRCCVRLAGCWSHAALWRGSTSNHCSCRAPIGGSWPVAAKPLSARRRRRTQVMGRVDPCWPPDLQDRAGSLRGSWSISITPLPPRCTPPPSRR
jgi:1-acyl-sn-glycerol-3-phosphate acyltransferase